MSGSSDGGTAARDPEALRRAFADVGHTLTVDADGALALIRVPPGRLAEVAEARTTLVAIARSHGFTHLAVELVAPPSDACVG